MSANLKISAAIAAAFAAVAAALLALSGASSGGGTATTAAAAPAAPSGAPAGGGEPALVRPDSHRLSTAPDGRVTLVEFLDFECESCRAVYPVVEQLREQYRGRVTFVLRYFPIPSHANAENAAIAVEAAAQQGRLEAMYRRMYDTQAEWGEQRDSKAATFRGFAQALGLDMAAYDRAVADPATLERVRRDRDDGAALGVRGTPTFFLNGQQLQPRTAQDLKASLDAALGA